MRLVTRLSLAAVLVLALLIGAGFLGAVHPAFDSFSHFRAHLAVLMLVAALPLFASDLLKVGALVVLAALLAFATTSATIPIPGIGMHYGPLYAADPAQPVYRLLQTNLRYNNPEPEKFLSLVGRIQPDVMTLDEVSQAWADKLSLLRSAYPYSIVCKPLDDVWAVALLSRRPFAAGTAPRCDRRGAFATATVDLGGRRVDIAALHLGWPWPFGQNWQVRGLRPDLAGLAATAILAGDLNAVPWSRTVAQVAEAGGLTLMPSAGASWINRRIPIALIALGLPIDQVFAKGNVRMHSIRRLDPVGSDHLPVLAEFSLAPGDDAPVEMGESDVAKAEPQRLRVSAATSRSTLPPG